MISGWHKTWSRLRQMSGDELRTRAGQEVMKRVDLARYRIGLPVGSPARQSSSRTAKFFFSVHDLPERVRLLRERRPEECYAVVREADEIRRHEFRLLGYSGLHLGQDIDWHLDPVHGKRAPLEPWFRIKFLDFNQVGDHKITWELSRHQHLVTLAKAWLLTEDESYVTELMAHWDSWHKANPYPLGINWASSLEVAFRSTSWLWVLRLLEQCPALRAGFLDDVVSGLALNARYIERYLSTYFSPNTHLLGEAMALFFIGTLCPQIKGSDRWQKNGWEILVAEAGRQVRGDGVYFEQALYYHVYALDFFLHSRLLAARNGIEIPAEFDSTVRSMLNVLQVLSQGGPPESFGDDDGGRLFNARRNRKEHMRDPLALGAVTFADDDLGSAAALTEEAIWLFGEKTNCIPAEPDSSTALRSKALEAGGLYVMASSQQGPCRIVIDAGPQGTGRGGHGHADALSVTVSMDGRPWLVDPGTYVYISNGEERSLFRGTGAHSTLRVDAQDQAVPDPPFGWTSLPSVTTETWVQGATFDLFAGSHTGYRRLADPVLHRRFVFHVHGAFWLVRDLAEGDKVHELETLWHFAADLTVEQTGDAMVLRPVGRDSLGLSGRQLALLPAADKNWDCELSESFLAPAYGLKAPAPVLRCKAKLQLPAEHAMILVPLSHPSEELGTFAETGASAQDTNVSAYRWDRQNETHYIVFARSAGAWRIGPCESDAGFCYCSLNNGQVTHLIFSGGSFAALYGETVVTHQVALERFEWISKNGRRQIHTSDGTCQVMQSALESTALR